LQRVSQRRRRAHKKRLVLRKAAVLLGESLAMVLPLVVYESLLIWVTGKNASLAPGVALDAYGAQIQVLGVLALLAPLLFVVREKVKPVPSKLAIQLTVVYASLIIVISVIGIGWSLLAMINSWFDVAAVGTPFGLALLDSSGLLFYMLGITGIFDRLMSWAGWSFE